jgi:hypothetical protein
MSTRPLTLAACCVAVGLLLLSPLRESAGAQTPPPTSPPAIDSTSTLAGVYSEEQAKRGKDTYVSVCKSCHNPSTGDAFAKRWAGKTLFDLFTYIYENMPDNNPRSVDEATDADIIGYLMQSTGMPVGTRDVPISADSLKAIRILVKKDSTQPPPARSSVGRAPRLSSSVPVRLTPRDSVFVRQHFK